SATEPNEGVHLCDFRSGRRLVPGQELMRALQQGKCFLATCLLDEPPAEIQGGWCKARVRRPGCEAPRFHGPVQDRLRCGRVSTFHLDEAEPHQAVGQEWVERALVERIFPDGHAALE